MPLSNFLSFLRAIYWGPWVAYCQTIHSLVAQQLGLQRNDDQIVYVCVLPYPNMETATNNCVFKMYTYMYIHHGPPKPTCLEGFMVNNLVFRWPKHSCFMVWGAHGIHIWGINSQADLMWKHPLKIFISMEWGLMSQHHSVYTLLIIILRNGLKHMSI